MKEIAGKCISKWKEEFPILSKLMQLEESIWINPQKQAFKEARENCTLTMADIIDASQRLERFADYFMKAFPETIETCGILESPIQKIPNMQKVLEDTEGVRISGNLYLKCDSHLPISGSIKARGGIYEVLKFAEEIAIREGLLEEGMSYAAFHTPEFREVFSKYSVCVGSTGNLGLSIGIISAKLGFRVVIHMSMDAQEWKKKLLREKGVVVVEHTGDYSLAVEEGRITAEKDPNCHFVDDENSITLFLGYAVAALRLEKQLKKLHLKVDDEHPLFVYLPCGVGGGPGGVCFGLKQMYQDKVHCFFVEPTHSPCMMLGLSTGYHEQVSVNDFGIDNRTAADGLAVGRASRFVGRTIQPFLSGAMTVEDAHLFQFLARLANSEGIRLEPSALAGMQGPLLLMTTEEGKQYLLKEGLSDFMNNATHIVWATGGSMVPNEIMDSYLAIANQVS